MNKPDTQTTCLVTLVTLLLGFPLTIWFGYVLSILWVWFIIPAFHVQPLTIPLAIGVALTVRYIIMSSSQIQPVKEGDEIKNLITGTIASILLPAFALAVTVGATQGRTFRESTTGALAADTIVLPGHGDATTIGAESPHLQEWADRGW